MPLYKVEYKVKTLIEAVDVWQATDRVNDSLILPPGLFVIDAVSLLLKKKPKWWTKSIFTPAVFPERKQRWLKEISEIWNSERSTHRVSIVRGPDSLCVFLNGKQIAGPDLSGAGEPEAEWTIDNDLIQTAINEGERK